MVDEYGRLDVLGNNAGVHVEGTNKDVTPAEWDHVVAVNLSGAFYCSKFAAPALKDADGTIGNVSSVSAIEGGPDRRTRRPRPG